MTSESSDRNQRFLSELLSSERAKWLVGIRDTDHGSLREELRRRQKQVERLLAHLESV